MFVLYSNGNMFIISVHIYDICEVPTPIIQKVFPYEVHCRVMNNTCLIQSSKDLDVI